MILAAEDLGRLPLDEALRVRLAASDAWDAARRGAAEDGFRVLPLLGEDAGKLAGRELVYPGPGGSTLGESVVRAGAELVALVAAELAPDKQDAVQSEARSCAARVSADAAQSELPDAAVGASEVVAELACSTLLALNWAVSLERRASEQAALPVLLRPAQS